MFLSKTGEPVNEEAWQWVAEYSDGSQLRQFDYQTQKYHYFAEIDQSRVVAFGLVKKDEDKAVRIDIPENAKLIHFYDNIIQHPQGGSAMHHRLYGFGYQLSKNKKIFTVLPNDFVVENEPDKVMVV